MIIEVEIAVLATVSLTVAAITAAIAVAATEP
jgi:hypothetical protein